MRGCGEAAERTQAGVTWHSVFSAKQEPWNEERDISQESNPFAVRLNALKPPCCTWTLQTGCFLKRILLQSEQKSCFLNSFPVTEVSANRRYEMKWERVQDSKRLLFPGCHVFATHHSFLRGCSAVPMSPGMM